MNGDKFDLNENAKNIIKGKEGRTLNIKNIIKGIVILFAVIAILASFFGAFRSFGKNGSKEEKFEEDLQEKEVGQELKDIDYANRNTLKVVDEQLKNNYEEDEDPDVENPEYNIPAVEPDPIEEYIKAQELKKVQRYYEAREAPFKKNINKTGEVSTSELYSESEINTPAYSSDKEYLDYIMAGIGDNNTNPNMQKEKKQFLKNAAVNSFVLKNPLTPPISKYEVKTGTLIPVVITSSINSDLPGSISAMVRENIYDTLTGTEILIPAGSKLYGKFSSEVSWGQTRVQVVFNRLTLPNGKSINLGAMGAADAQGRSGLTGDIDLHLGKVIGSIVMAGVVGGADGALTNNGNYRKDGNSALSRAGEESGRTAIETVDKYTSKVLEVQPTIWVEAGSRATLMIEEDLILEKYDKSINYLSE